MEQDNEINVVKVQSLFSLTDPRIQEFMRREQEAYETMRDRQKKMIDAFDKEYYSKFITGE